MNLNKCENGTTNGSSALTRSESGTLKQPMTPSTVAETEPEPEPEPETEVDIVINNVVCSFSVRCHLNLRHIALNGRHVEYRRENGMVTMKIRKPNSTASIWSSGKITCTGATSEPDAKIAARKFARLLQKLGYEVRFHNYRVVNVLGTCSMPFSIRITQFTKKYPDRAQYEPELHPGVTYKIKSPKATLKIFSTGSITVTAPSVSSVQSAIEHVFPLVHEFSHKKDKTQLAVDSIAAAKTTASERQLRPKRRCFFADESENDDDADADVDDDKKSDIVEIKTRKKIRKKTSGGNDDEDDDDYIGSDTQPESNDDYNDDDDDDV